VATQARTNDTSTTSSPPPPTTEASPTTESTEPAVTLPQPQTTTTGAGTAGRDPYGIGDALFPSLGNPGIDVEHYDLTLQYDPLRKEISATVHLDIAMTADRATFSLDSAGPVVSAVSVDGVPAAFEPASPELLITPATPLSRGQHIGVDVAYTVTNPGPRPSAAGGAAGWFPTPSGSYVLHEPEGAHFWMPSDDHPSDKATFRFEVTVPSGLTAVANGALVDHTSATSTDTWIWQEDRPMATYLIQLLTGNYETVDGVGPNNLPLLSVVLHEDRQKMQVYLDTIDDQIDFFDDFFGPYPLDRYGIAITDSVPGLAMETMERSLFSRSDFSTGRLEHGQELLLSHELAHQWFGDAVSPARWSDVWLNESFATYGEWMWLDHIGLQPLEASAAAALAGRQPGATADPAADEMFGFNSYDGGAVVLHALRKTIGDDSFFSLLKRWVADNNGQSRTTQDFVSLANQVAGRDLTEFFKTWLYSETVPTTFPA
jgi:aminopeptidase N